MYSTSRTSGVLASSKHLAQTETYILKIALLKGQGTSKDRTVIFRLERKDSESCVLTVSLDWGDSLNLQCRVTEAHSDTCPPSLGWFWRSRPTLQLFVVQLHPYHRMTRMFWHRLEMPISLCRTCLSSDADLFSAALDDPVCMDRPGWLHSPQSSADPRLLPETLFECTQVQLKRAIIDLNQAIVISLARSMYLIRTSLVYLPICVSSPKTLIGAVS